MLLPHCEEIPQAHCYGLNNAPIWWYCLAGYGTFRRQSLARGMWVSMGCLWKSRKSPVLGCSDSGWEAEHHRGTSMWRRTPVEGSGEFNDAMRWTKLTSLERTGSRQLEWSAWSQTPNPDPRTHSFKQTRIWLGDLNSICLPGMILEIKEQPAAT